MACLYLVLITREHDPVCRIGYILLSFSWLYQLGGSAVAWLRENGAPRHDDREGQRQYSRAGVLRRLRRARSVRRWQAALPVSAFALGLTLIFPGGVIEHPIYSAIAFAICGWIGYFLTVIHYSPRKIEAQLARWDERYGLR